MTPNVPLPAGPFHRDAIAARPRRRGTRYLFFREAGPPRLPSARRPRRRPPLRPAPAGDAPAAAPKRRPRLDAPPPATASPGRTIDPSVAVQRLSGTFVGYRVVTLASIAPRKPSRRRRGRTVTADGRTITPPRSPPT